MFHQETQSNTSWKKHQNQNTQQPALQTDKSKTGLINILLPDDCAKKGIQSEALKLQIYRNCRIDAS